jgi:5-methylcytosine-specific restriction enzyme subunit McrC
MTPRAREVVGVRHVRLREWQRQGPGDSEGLLAGVTLGDDAQRDRARRLTEERVLAITELRAGIDIRSFAYVGRIQLGDLVITVEPKLAAEHFLALLRYAYGLRNLRLLETVDFETSGLALQDLILQQLHAEVRELIERGLTRRYIRIAEALTSPRGRIDLNQVAASSAQLKTTLPCRHHTRSSQHLLNELLLSGLQLGTSLACDPLLKGSLHRLTRVLAELARPVALHAGIFETARRQVTRLTSSYTPALELIELLYRCSALSFGDSSDVKVSGFLFDMNRFFQALLSRFLRDHLDEYDVQEEGTLNDVLRYLPTMNPQRRKSPRPRPDFVVRKHGQVVALLDAKYRDLWERELPRDMLYQLSVYALSQPRGSTAAILYPTTATEARQAVIEIRDPVTGRAQGFVALRPVVLSRLVSALQEETGREARKLAAEFAFGREQAARRAVG